MKFGVVIFPGSNCDQDCLYVVRDVVGQEAVPLWHDRSDLEGCDAVILPGGFSYGDYLRTGAVAKFSPIMKAITRFADDGGYVLGICNGFQILLEAGLLPGAMLRNTSLRFICRSVTMRVERTDTPFTNKFQPGQVVRMPIAHNEGNYTADARILRELKRNSQVVFRYCDANGDVTPASNPNGSADAIAGVCNEAGNVMGLMPHPERAAEPELGSMDGKLIFTSIVSAMAHR